MKNLNFGKSNQKIGKNGLNVKLTGKQARRAKNQARLKSREEIALKGFNRDIFGL